MYSLEISNTKIFANYITEENPQPTQEIENIFLENLSNDVELLKTMYSDSIEILNDVSFSQNKKLTFRIKLILEFEANSNFYEIIKELKIPEICDNEFNTITKDPEKRILNLPYYVSFEFQKNNFKIDIFLFWLKKNNSYFDELKNNIFDEINDDMYFNSFFFCFIEHLKSNILIPEKNYLLFILQEINEISIIKASKNTFFEMLREFYFKRKKLLSHNETNLIFSSILENDIHSIEDNMNNLDFKEENSDDVFYYENNSKNLLDNNFSINIAQIQKRSDKLLENSIIKKNQTSFLKNTHNNINLNNNQIGEDNLSEYEKFFTFGGFKGEVITDRGSSFQAHAIKINSFDLVNKYTKILLTNNKILKATHNIMAYRFLNVEKEKAQPSKEDMKDNKTKNKEKTINLKKNLANSLSEGFDDDGEAGAGIRLIGILQKMKIYNVFVIVSRWFGGTLLGNDRFKYINDAAKNLLLENKNKFDYES